MWRRLLARAHPDAGGDHDLFIWADALREHVAGDVLEDRWRSAGAAATPDSPRVPYPSEASADFAATTRRALEHAERVPEGYARILRLLVDCRPSPFGRPLYEQRLGASYKRLAAIGHLAGMDVGARTSWYRIAEEIPLSDRHTSHLLAKLKGGP